MKDLPQRGRNEGLTSRIQEKGPTGAKQEGKDLPGDWLEGNHLPRMKANEGEQSGLDLVTSKKHYRHKPSIPASVHENRLHDEFKHRVHRRLFDCVEYIMSSKAGT